MTERKSPQKATGRPPRRTGERLSKNRTFRVRPQLDEQLTLAALHSGRSVSEEIELRLEQSFAKQESMFHALDLVYGRENTAIAMVVAELAIALGTHAPLASFARGKPEPYQAGGWLKDPFLFNEFVGALNLMFEGMRPDGKTGTPTEGPWPEGERGNDMRAETNDMLKDVGQRKLAELLARTNLNFELSGWATRASDLLSAQARDKIVGGKK